jgi:RNase P subunit RPR2
MLKHIEYWAAQILGYCGHNQVTFPQTDMHTHVTTISCLSCGQRFRYNWATMQREKALESRAGERA